MPQGLEYQMEISLVQHLAAVTHVAVRKKTKGEGLEFLRLFGSTVSCSSKDTHDIFMYMT